MVPVSLAVKNDPTPAPVGPDTPTAEVRDAMEAPAPSVSSCLVGDGRTAATTRGLL